MEFFNFIEVFRPAFKIIFLSPGLLLIFLIAGLFLFKNYFGRSLIFLTALSLYFVSIGASTHLLANSLEIYPALKTEQLLNSNAKAILILTAGYTSHNPEINDKSRPSKLGIERLNYAIRLNKLSNIPIIISGGKPNTEESSLAKIYNEWLIDRAGISAIALEQESGSTWENLQFTKVILDDLNIEKIIIVTHAFHMPRAMWSARKNDIDAIPAPFAFLGKKPKKPTNFLDLSLWAPNPFRLESNYLLLHELFGKFWYTLKN